MSEPKKPYVVFQWHDHQIVQRVRVVAVPYEAAGENPAYEALVAEVKTDGRDALGEIRWGHAGEDSARLIAIAIFNTAERKASPQTEALMKEITKHYADALEACNAAARAQDKHPENLASPHVWGEQDLLTLSDLEYLFQQGAKLSEHQLRQFIRAAARQGKLTQSDLVALIAAAADHARM